MYEISEQVSLEIENILYVRDWMSQEKAQQVILEMFTLCRENQIENMDFMITSSIETKSVDGKMITETEIMIPLKINTGELREVGKYKIKDKFLLTNAIVFKANYDKAMDPEFQKYMSGYIEQKNLQPITRAYTVTHKKKNSEMGILEIYIGINPNIL